jgi:glycosyltransferase involved in cell wall biosynthesis
MKVSVVTATYNSAGTVRDTLESVLGQDYPDIEYIVIDGNSKDETCEIVRSYGDAIACFVSEPDTGIYDALNKGIARCTGDIVALLHSDDVFNNTHVISAVVSLFREFDTDLLCTDIAVCRQNDLNSILRYYSCTRWKPWMFRIGHQPPHPGFFVKREVYRKHGMFDLNYRISADFDLMLRLIYKARIPVHYSKMLSVRMRDGGTSNAGWAARKKANREDHLSLKKNGYVSWLPLIYLKYLIKLFQFVRR